MIYTDNMDSKSFYGRRKVPLSATANVGGDVGVVMMKIWLNQMKNIYHNLSIETLMKIVMNLQIHVRFSIVLL